MQELEPAPDDLRALLEAEKASGDPTGGVRERVLLRLAGTIGLGHVGGLPPDARSGEPSGTGASATAGSAHILPTTGLVRTIRAVAVFMTGAAAGAGGYHLVDRSRHAPPAPVPVAASAARPEVPIPSEIPPPPPTPPSAGAANATGSPTRLRTAEPPEASHRSAELPNDPLAAERSLLEMARAALGRGQAQSALAALRRHARQFPSGELTEEREGLLVQSLVAAQKYDQAREKADQFKKRYPRSLFAPVVDQAIGSIP